MLGIVSLPNTITSTAYVASKHAVMGLTKTDGVFYADKRIRINAICPGYVETPLLLASEKTGAMAAEFARIPAGRLAKMEEIASAIVFLASPMSSYMNGAGLIVDGYVHFTLTGRNAIANSCLADILVINLDRLWGSYIRFLFCSGYAIYRSSHLKSQTNQR
jgi:hypothetical protein